MIDRATVDKIMDAADIVDVISEFVSLRKRGTSYKGLCPFHDDHTPSFSVSPSRGVYKCFSCGASGNVVKFLMDHEQLTYPEALRWLAKKYNIEIHERELTSEEKQHESDRESMLIMNEWAQKHFEDLLHNDVDGLAIGMQYFRGRGFRDDTIREFHLGYALQSRHALVDAARKAGYKDEYLVKTGLCYERDNGELVDRFAGRVIFPWQSVSGQTIGFTGRVLDQRTHGVNQKYVNSPESEVYHKSNALYGIYQAKKEISRNDRVFLVEGQADVISMHQSGIVNVVANSGVALTMPQIRLLHRFTSNITLIYDGDAAGINAALRGTDLLLSEGMNVKVLLLPDGQDPDDFARKNTAAELQKYIDSNSTDFVIFKTRQLLDGVTDPIKRSQAVNSIVQSIAVIKDQILRATYIRECSARTGIDEPSLVRVMNQKIRQSIDDQRRQQQREAERQQAGPAPVADDEQQPPHGSANEQRQRVEAIGVAHVDSQESQVERMLIQAVIRNGEKTIIRGVEDEASGQKVDLTVAQYVSYDLGLDGLQFANPAYNEILAEAAQHSGEEGFKAITFFTNHHDMTIANIAADLGTDDYQISESLKEKETEDRLREQTMHLVLDFRMNYVDRHLKDLQQQLKASTNDTAKMMELMKEIKDMQEVRNIMARKLGNDILI